MRESVLSNLEGLRMASTPMERDNFVNAIIEQFDYLYRENKELCHDKEILMEWINDNKNMRLLVLDLIKQQKYQELKAENARLREERRWRKCSELPEDKQLCEVVDKYGDVSLWIYSGALKMIFLHKFKYWRLFEYPPGQNVNHQNTK